jgi:hypothetical protein
MTTGPVRLAHSGYSLASEGCWALSHQSKRCSLTLPELLSSRVCRRVSFVNPACVTVRAAEVVAGAAAGEAAVAAAAAVPLPTSVTLFPSAPLPTRARIALPRSSTRGPDDLWGVADILHAVAVTMPCFGVPL